MSDQKIFATEEDRVNCPFYFKIGACRNGDRCNRAHIRPTSSQTLLLPHMYPNTQESMNIANDEDWDDEMYARAQEHVEMFYEEVFLELANYGEIEDLVVLDNVSDHMLGNVYCKFYHEESAERAMKKLGGRFYGGRLIQAEFTPVTDFREARCRAFHETRCARGGLCNFMHIKHIPKAVKRRLVREMYEEHPEFAGPGASHHVGRSRSARRRRKKADEKEGGKKKRQTSEERRAMIAQWNKERATELQAAAGFVAVA
mmetsp:Transcript_50533/g.156380  ORF Transcript_50533/g.156380 Transcript_50533/m.156380 type:complete len:258 (+) Transcript_50533:94-867(+)